MSFARIDCHDRDGFAMVTALLVVLLLSVIAVAAIIIATTEKRTTVAEAAHSAAVFSADAGGEAGIHFLRMSGGPPMIIDFADSMVVAPASTNLQGLQTYEFACWFAGSGRRPGWDASYVDRTYRVQSTGEAAAGGRSDVRLLVTRTYREGY